MGAVGFALSPRVLDAFAILPGFGLPAAYLATLWTLAHALLPGSRDAVWMHVLDAFWPLSMLGMFIIGVKIAVTGRWRGAARFWPVVAESWAVVTVPVMATLGETAGQIVGVGHLLVGYTTLGLILALRPELTGARD